MSGSDVSLVFPQYCGPLYINENILRFLYTIYLFKGFFFFFSFLENDIPVSKRIFFSDL